MKRVYVKRISYRYIRSTFCHLLFNKIPIPTQAIYYPINSPKPKDYVPCGVEDDIEMYEKFHGEGNIEVYFNGQKIIKGE